MSVAAPAFFALAVAAAPSTSAPASLQSKTACTSSCDVSSALSAMLNQSSCPSADEMYLAMAAVAPQPRTFMSVGCNRGEDLVRFAQMFDRTGTYNHSAWVGALEASGLQARYDVCGATVPASVAGAPPAPDGMDARRAPVAYCVEGMRSNVQLLNATVARLPPALASSFRVVGKAFGDADEAGGTQRFVDCPPGYEASGLGKPTGGLGPITDCDEAYVSVDSVDTYMEAHGLTTLDALFVDTEGHDPAVLRGASRLLARGAVRYVEFEVHRDLPFSVWAESRLLSDVTTPLLEANGYECYWMGHERLTRLSGCHLPVYDHEALSWSNVACVLRTDPWHAVVDARAAGGLCEVWGE